MAKSTPSSSTFAGTRSRFDAVEDLADDKGRDEAEQEHQHRAGEIAERIDVRKAFIGRGRLSPQHEARDHDAEEPAIAVHRHGAHRIVDLEAALDEVVQLVADDGHDRADQHRLDRMIEIVAGRGRDDAAKPRRERPEGIALRDDVAGHHPARQRHQEVEGDRRERGRREIDVGRRPGLAGDLTGNRGRADDRDVAGGVEAPEAGIDQEQADRDQPDIVGRDVARRAVGPELADARAEHDQEGERRAAGDRMHDADA